MRKTALALAAALAGASGLALETLLLDCAGLGLGHGRSTALGLSTFLAAWALGAYRAGRSRRSPRADLLGAGAGAALVAVPAVWVVIAGGSAPGGVLTLLTTLAAISVAGFLQGAFLVPLARAGAGGVAWLFAANLAGAAGGAVWIANRVVADSGRIVAALAAGALAAAAGGIGAWASPGSANVEAGRAGASRAPAELGWPAAAWILAFATAWVASLEWIGLRLGVLWLGGMQPALRSVLAASLIALALGAGVLPGLLPRGRLGVLSTLVLCSLASLWPFFAALALRRLGLPGRAPLAGGELRTALVLVLPSLAPFGALVPVLHRALPLESGERLGRLLLHEAGGALVGVPLLHFLLVPRVGLGGSIALLELCGLAGMLALARSLPPAARLAALLPLLLGAWAWLRPAPALDSPPLANPAFRVRSFEEDRDFAVSVVDDGIVGERTLLTDGFRAAGTGPDYVYMQVLGHLPVLLSPHPRRVAVLALGTGTTLGAVASHPEVERIDVLEISAAVVRAAPWFAEMNGGALALDRSRVVVRLGDGRATLAAARGAYDVITMEPLLPDSPFGVYLYTREFYERARQALAPGGLVCQWVPPHALEPASFVAVIDAFSRAFPWSSIWLSGTQAILVGSEEEPVLDPSRFETAGPLRERLEALGLATPARWLAQLVVAGARAGASRPGEGTRELTDFDPWIIYRPRRQGPELLADLPRNLAFLRSIAAPPPAGWLAAAGPDSARTLEGMAALRAAREAHAFGEARLRGGPSSSASGPRFEESMDRARALLAGDPEVSGFERELAFLEDVRGGVSALAADRTREGARSAVPLLLAAARLRPGRGDVHLYAAAAFERLGDPAAEAELRLALEACPRIARTQEGQRSRALGLSDAAWSRVEAAAAESEREFFTKRPSGRSPDVVRSSTR